MTPSQSWSSPVSVARRVLAEAPYLPRCSDNKTASLVRPTAYAIRYPYMQVNRVGMVSWLIFDLDHVNANIWDDNGLPAPNLIVRNRKNGHAHLYYAIVPVCTSENARTHPQQYMKAIYKAFCDRLQADEAYSGPVAKTPFHPWWDTTEIHDREYELGELADYVELPSRTWSTGPDLDAVAHSRHCTLFEELRYYAYSIVTKSRENSTYQRFYRELEAYAFNHNNFRNRGFSADLRLSEVKATVKSVSRWTWDHYTGSSRCHRGAMSLDRNLPLQERQRLAAERTHSQRRNATLNKIRGAIARLLQEGKRITLLAIAGITSLSRQTVSKYKDEIAQRTQQKDVVTPLSEAITGFSVNVKHGVHQITAPAYCLVSQTRVSVSEVVKEENEEGESGLAGDTS